MYWGICRSCQLDFSLGMDLILDGGLEIVGSYKARDHPLRFIRLLPKSVNLIGLQKGSIFVKMFKNLLLRNHKGDEAET